MITENQKQIISAVAEVKREFICEKKSDWNDGRIVMKAGFVRTEYFANKRSLQIAMRVFCKTDWKTVSVWIGFQAHTPRIFCMKAERNEFLKFWDIEKTKTGDASYMIRSFWGKEFHRNDVVRFAEKFKI